MQIIHIVTSQSGPRQPACDYHILLTTEYDEVINNPKHSFFVSARLAHLTCTATATTEEKARLRAMYKLITRLNKNEAYTQAWARDYRPTITKD